MDIRNMRQLLAIRRHGSFARAAEELGISQPSLSAAIARLEDQLKVRLFERTPGGSRLTAIGELLAERAAKVVAETEQIVQEAAMIAGGEAGLVRLGVGTSLREAFLPRFVSQIAGAHPALGLEVQVLDRDLLLPMLRRRELDLAICVIGEDVGDDLVATEVFVAHAVAVARPDHPLVAERGVSLDRFVEFPGAGTTLKEFANIRLLAPGQDPGAVSRYRSNDYDPLIALALGGHATLIAPAFVVQAELDAGRLAPIDLDWSFKISFAAIATRAASYSPMVSRIVRYATALGAELQEAGPL